MKRIFFVSVLILAYCSQVLANKIVLDDVRIVSRNSEFVFFIEKDSDLYYALDGFEGNRIDTRSSFKNRGKYVKDKVLKIWYDTEDNQIYVSLKKNGKKRISELELLHKLYGRTTFALGGAGLGVFGIGIGVLTAGAVTLNVPVIIAGGIISLTAIIPFIFSGKGDFRLIDLRTCDVFYKVKDENELKVYQKAKEDFGTFPHDRYKASN